jgi:nitrate/nitrite-specific signal transduction histidine kinase
VKFLIRSICLLLAFSVLPAQAEITNLSQAINESGRLRMLSQRLAKAYLLKAMDIQPEKVSLQFINSKAIFEKNLAQLTRFSESLSDSATLKHAINTIKTQWQAYRQVLNQPISTVNANEILALSDKTLTACEGLVAQLEKRSLRQSAHWVNLSGRQRMLSQRIAKFYSAISLSGDTSIYHKGLQQAVNEFDTSLLALIHSPDNTRFLDHKLKKVATQWNFSKQGLQSLNKGESTPLVIFMTTETILKQMNDITALYEVIDRKRKPHSTG